MTNRTKISRRAVMSAIVTAGVTAPFGKGFLRTAGAQSGSTAAATAFALTGDESHNPDVYRTAFQKTLVEDAGLSIDFSDEEKLLSYETLRRYRILIMFRNGTRHPGGYTNLRGNIVSVPPLQRKLNSAFVATVTEEQCEAIKRWVEEGGSLWAWHNNSRLSLMRKAYRDVQGATIIGHPPIRPFKVKIINHDHPITKDVNDFVITDEQHFLVYEKDPKYVLAISVNEDGLTYKGRDGKLSSTCEAVWAYDYGKGRVCMMTPGHDIMALWNPEYEKMQRNAVRWLLHET